MGRHYKYCLAITLVLFLAGCCAKFDDLSANARYNVGDTFTTSNTEIKVEKFQYGNGQWSSDGYAEVDQNNYAQGSDYALRANNANLNFMFAYPKSRIALRFADLGGNTNIRINGVHKSVNDILALNNTNIGGVSINIVATQQGTSNWIGSMILEGEITDFAIGGQELWIDTVCPK